MKSKNKKDQKTEFQEESVESDVNRLMKQLGVRKLIKTSSQCRPVKRKAVEDPVEFNDKNEWSITLNQPGRKSKYTKQDLLTKISPSKKRKKISPGFVPDAELDLHGCNRVEALQKINRLIDLSRKQKYKIILIITGRGLSSEQGEGVLRRVVWNWLQENQVHFQFNCRWAPEFLGGKGAILVFFN
jgi:DNA-nicking Smr family endonuclease